MASVVEAIPAVPFSVTEQRQYPAIALLFMSFFLQDMVDHLSGGLTDVTGPAQKTLRRPLAQRLVMARHMLGTGTVRSFAVAARMTGHPPAMAINGNGGVGCLYLYLLFHQMMRYRVVVLVVLDVVIDMHSRVLNLGVLIRVCRQRSQRRLVELLKLTQTCTGQLFEGALVEVLQQEPNGLVKAGQGEEGLVTQARHDPALDNLHRHFGFGLVLRFIRPGGHYGNAIVGRQLLVSRVDIRFVAMGLADTAF